MTNLKANSMQTFSVAQAKTHLSELLVMVEGGEELQISRRGRAIARLVPEPKVVANLPFDFSALAAFVDGQTALADNSVLAMRSQDSY
jgi:prevent-host-death family protein